MEKGIRYIIIESKNDTLFVGDIFYIAKDNSLNLINSDGWLVENEWKDIISEIKYEIHKDFYFIKKQKLENELNEVNKMLGLI